MTDLLIDMVEFFVSKGLVQGDGVDTFRDTAPNDPDHITSIYEYSSSTPLISENITNRSIQLVVRDSSATKAKEDARALYNALCNESNINSKVFLTPNRWCMLTPRQTPFKIKVDSAGRVYYGFNLGVLTHTD